MPRQKSAIRSIRSFVCTLISRASLRLGLAFLLVVFSSWAQQSVTIRPGDNGRTVSVVPTSDTGVAYLPKLSNSVEQWQVTIICQGATYACKVYPQAGAEINNTSYYQIIAGGTAVIKNRGTDFRVVGAEVSNDGLATYVPGNLNVGSKVSAGIQGTPTGGGKDSLVNSGYLETDSADGNYWIRLQQYQYGAAIRSNNRLLEIMLNDHGLEIPTEAVTNNANSEHLFGSRFQVRDKFDISGMDMDCHTLAAGSPCALLTSGTDMPGSPMQFYNQFSDGFLEFGQSGTDATLRANVKIGQLSGFNNNYFLVNSTRSLGDTTRGLSLFHVVIPDGTWGGMSDYKQFMITGATTNKRLVLSYDTSGNFGVIQAGAVGDDYKTLKLNPSGGLTSVGAGLQEASTAAKATCAVGIRGEIYVEKGSTGVADQPFLCAKKSDNTYAWVQLVTVP